MKKILNLLMVGCLTMTIFATSSLAKDNFKMATSIYVGWLPWLYASESGLLNQHAQAEGITIEVEKINDYVESINLYTATDDYDAVTMTTMDALSIPAVSGIQSTIEIIGDYSNGNDAIISKTAKTVSDLKGSDVYLVELSVSHYLLATMLDKAGLSERDLKVVNNSDSDLATVYLSDNEVKHTVTWNPVLGQILNDPNSSVIADSSEIPYEILDVVATKGKDARLGRALRATWADLYEIITDKQHANHKELIEFMARVSGDNVTTKEIYSQIKATHFFSPTEEASFRKGEKIVEVMNKVRNFIFDKGLFGDLPSVDSVGMSFENGKVLGAKDFVMLKF